METRKVSPEPISPEEFKNLKPGDVCETFHFGKITVTIARENATIIGAYSEDLKKEDIYFNFEIASVNKPLNK